MSVPPWQIHGKVMEFYKYWRVAENYWELCELQESDSTPASETIQCGLWRVAAEGDVRRRRDTHGLRVSAPGEGLSDITTQLRASRYSVQRARRQRLRPRRKLCRNGTGQRRIWSQHRIQSTPVVTQSSTVDCWVSSKELDKTKSLDEWPQKWLV